MAFFGRESARDRQRVEAYREWFVRQHPLALASAVLSVFSLTHFGTLWVDEIAGIVLGAIAIRSVRRTGGRSKVWLAYVGIVAGVLSLILAIVLYTIRPG
ncbi:MAG TPA: DUF4190 domain-containing protein [Tepidisphaeraceae bacterium]|nr:DUF4190 domain-containing protein [Tepidisphaeraceae bacterium]